MPLEIRELVIKTSINDNGQAQAANSGSGDSGGTGNQDAIVAACVEQVLSILKEKEER
jgi:Family of unknown function (DUF5908)